jgi:predicted ribosome quality control (RQC) complex YloA/Tae2 family protein
MPLDGLTLAATRAELSGILLGSRVQKIVQVDQLSMSIESYGNHRRGWLVLSADPQQPKVYLASERPGRGVDTPSPLLLLMRKHLEGLWFVDVSQPPGDRILIFALAERDRAADELAENTWAPVRPTFRLIIEAISQFSNLILVDDRGNVVDAVRRVSAEQNRTRVTLPHHPYQPPPSQPKRGLEVVDEAGCLAALESVTGSTTIWQSLVLTFAGLGPVSAREVVYRATGDAKARAPGDSSSRRALANVLAGSLASIVEPVLRANFAASVAFAADAKTSGSAANEIVEFAPYALTHLMHWELRPSLSRAAEEFYRQTRGIRAVDVARRSARAAIAAERALAEKKRDSLQRALAGTSRADTWRQQGELLLAHSSAVPRGATTFRVDGVDLELNPRLSAVENAQQIFRRYRKAKAALREVPGLLEDAETRLRYLDEVAALAEIADTSDAVRAIQSDVRPRRLATAQSRRSRRVERPIDSVLRLRTSGGRELLVGRSALQNDAVTFDLGRPDDVWLHARGCPGAHVILRTADGKSSANDLVEAAQVAAYYSANRDSTKVTVDWTNRRNVRRSAKATPGLVTYTGETSLVVKPASQPLPHANDGS